MKTKRKTSRHALPEHRSTVRAGTKTKREAFIRRVQTHASTLRQLAAGQEADDDLRARAACLLLMLEGLPEREIAAQTGLSWSAVIRARRRFELYGLPGLNDAPRLPVSPRSYLDKDDEAMAGTMELPPDEG